MALTVDKSISQWLGVSAVFTVLGLWSARYPFKNWTVPICAIGGTSAAIISYRRNQPNKNIELYLKLAEQVSDNIFADEMTRREIVGQKQQEIELMGSLAKLEEIKGNVQARLSEFE